MKFFHTFFTDLRNCFVIQHFARQAITRTFGRNLKFLYTFYVLAAFLGLIALSVFLYRMSHHVPGFVNATVDYAHDAYPAELVVTIDNGELSTNVQEPFAIDFPEAFAPEDEEDLQVRHLITIDTEASIDQYHEYDSLVLVGKHWLAFPDKNSDSLGSYQVMPLKEIKHLVINRQLYDQMLLKLIPLTAFIQPVIYVGIVLLLLVGPFVVGGALLLGSLFWLLFLSLLGWLFALIMKTGLGYSQVYKLSMYAVVPAVIYGWVALFLGITFPFVQTIIYACFLIAALKGCDAPVVAIAQPSIKSAKKPPSKRVTKKS